MADSFVSNLSSSDSYSTKPQTRLSKKLEKTRRHVHKCAAIQYHVKQYKTTLF